MPELPDDPAVDIAFETVTEPDVTESEFLKVMQGISERGERRKATDAARQAASDFNLVADRHAERSERSQALDESLDAKLTTDADKWASAPGRFDFPGIDTTDERGFDFDK
jgi:hypothetical protein